MKRKGISPLIAAVLLIAFTMAVASLFAQWAPQLIQNAQGDTSNQTEEVQACSSATLSFVSASKNTSIVRQATGDTEIGKITVNWFYEGDDPKQNTTILNGSGSADRLVAAGSSWSNKDLDRAVAQAQNCEGAGSATYTP